MPSTVYTKIHGDVSPLKDHVLVIDMEQGDKISNGIIILDDNGKDRGIRPRWAKVYKVGKNIDWIEPNQWILVENARWTYGMPIVLDNGDEIYLQRVDTSAIMMVSDEKPADI